MTITVINPDAIYSFKAAREAVGFGETFLRKEIKEGRLQAKKAGGRIVKIKGEDIIKWFNALPSASDDTPSSGEEDRTDGRPSGPEKTAEERGLTSALRHPNP